MRYNKITNLLGKLTEDEIPKFTTIKWIEIFDQSNGTYNPNKDIRFKTPQIRDDFCDFNDAYIVVTGKVNATNANVPPIVNYSRSLSLKNSVPFFNCTSKINNQLIEDAQDLDIENPVYNLLYYTKNFRKTTGSFWNYYPDKPSSGYNNNNTDRIFYPVRNSESFNNKTKLVDNLPAGNDVELNDIKFVIPLKNLSKFIFNLKSLMINTEIELILKWSQNCVLTEKPTREQLAAGDDPVAEPVVNPINKTSDLKFNITDCKLYVPVVTLQEKYENELF